MDELVMVDLLFTEPPAPSPDVAAQSRAALLRRIHGGPSPACSPRRTNRLVPAALGAAAVGAAAAITFAGLNPGGGAGSTTAGHGQGAAVSRSPAAAFLLAMAAKAAHTPASGRFWCDTVLSGTRGLVGAGDKTLSPSWLDGSASMPASPPAGYRYAIFDRSRMLDCMELPRKGFPGGTVGGSYQDLGAQPASPADMAAWRRDGSPQTWQAWYDSTQRISASPGPREWTGPKLIPAGDKPNWVAYASLPTDPAKMKAALLELGSGSGDQNQFLFSAVIDVMNNPASPAVRATAYKVLAGLPGIQMRQGVRDPEGQIGTAVWMGKPGRPPARMTLIDPPTASLVADVTLAATRVDGTAPGTVLYYTAIVSEGWTNHLPVPMSYIRKELRAEHISAKP